MKRILLIVTLILLYFFISCQSHYNSVCTNSNLTDSIKNILNIDDSIAVLFDGSEKYSDYEKIHIVIVDYNCNSIFHKQLEGRKYDRITKDSALINEIYKEFNSAGKLFDVTFPLELKGYWYQAHKKNGIFYLHRPCCFTPVDMINDTVYLDDNMTGGVPLFLVAVQNNNGKYILTTKKYDYSGNFFNYSFSLELIDKNKMIYRFSDGDKCEYLIHESKINSLPIIYEYCNMKIFPNTVEFDSIICE